MSGDFFIALYAPKHFGFTKIINVRLSVMRDFSFSLKGTNLPLLHEKPSPEYPLLQKHFPLMHRAWGSHSAHMSTVRKLKIIIRFLLEKEVPSKLCPLSACVLVSQLIVASNYFLGGKDSTESWRSVKWIFFYQTSFCNFLNCEDHCFTRCRMCW